MGKDMGQEQREVVEAEELEQLAKQMEIMEIPELLVVLEMVQELVVLEGMVVMLDKQDLLPRAQVELVGEAVVEVVEETMEQEQ
jgi:hypothetical protein